MKNSTRNMRLPLFIARKIYGNEGEQQKVSRPAIRIATIGVALGIAVIIVSVSVILGFKHTIRDKVVGFGSHIVVANYFTLQCQKDMPVQANDSLMQKIKAYQGVKHAQRYAMTQGILKTDTDFLGIAFKGVAEDFDTTFIASNLVEGTVPHFSSTKNSNNILISRIMADKLHLSTGDKVFGYFLADGNMRMRKYNVSGIYETNLTKYDETLCFTDLYGIVKINGWNEDEVTGIEVTLNNMDDLPFVYDKIIDNVNKTNDKYFNTYSSASIQEQNPQIFSWLELLDLNVWIILVLMICVAGFTMISGLLIIILERIQMIGIMKAIGARNSVIRNTFLWFSVFIISKGLLWGNILGLGICIIQKYFGLIKLDPSTYYVSTAPIEMDIPLIASINIGTLLICVLILVVPSFFISHIHPARSMRYE